MSVYTWGFGNFGQLGNGRTDTCHTPVSPNFRGSSRAVGLASGGYYTAALTDEGVLYTFGCGKYGRLGTGDDTDRSEPNKMVVKEDGKDVRFTQVSCGLWHGAAISKDGTIYVWGFGRSHGVIGDGHAHPIAPPTPLDGPFTTKIAGISCGNNFTLLWTDDGQAYSWGCGRHGVLGHKEMGDRHTPTAITGFETGVKVTFMNAGFAHCGAITDKGQVLMFGKGEDGALGFGKDCPKEQKEPRLIECLAGVVIKELSCIVGEKHGHTLFVTSEGQVYATGDGYKGKLGLGDQTSRLSPTALPSDSFDGETIRHVSAGGIHSAAVSEQGHVFTWGCGSDGRLGHPEGKGHRYLFRSDCPRKVEALQTCGRATDVSCSYYHTVAILHNETEK